MSSISGTSLPFQSQSPRDALQTQLQSQVSSGEVSEDDEETLASALDKIDEKLSSSRPTAGSKPPSSEELQEKVDSLIAEQVASGDLTEEQATKLSEVFAETFSNGPPGGAGGPPPGGPPPGGPPPEGADASSSTEESDEDDSIAELLNTFLEQLREDSSNSNYSIDGSSDSSSTDKSVFFDIST